MAAATPRFAALDAPAHWRVVDFISDLHLQASDPRTREAWQAYLTATAADAVFILGDLFEAWIGDDVLADTATADDEHTAFERGCVQALCAASARRAVFFMHGNRDFLIGAGFAQASGATLLDDPTVLAFAGQRWLLSHGDALCLDDRDYQVFRQQVRAAAWQREFLAQPLAQRRALARGLRDASEARKRSGAPYADADPALMQKWLRAADARELIHGHTHRPADHVLTDGGMRRVLSDWDAAATPPRAEVLRLHWRGDTQAAQVLRLPATVAATAAR